MQIFIEKILRNELKNAKITAFMSICASFIFLSLFIASFFLKQKLERAFIVAEPSDKLRVSLEYAIPEIQNHLSSNAEMFAAMKQVIQSLYTFSQLSTIIISILFAIQGFMLLYIDSRLAKLNNSINRMEQS